MDFLFKPLIINLGKLLFLSLVATSPINNHKVGMIVASPSPTILPMTTPSAIVLAATEPIESPTPSLVPQPNPSVVEIPSPTPFPSLIPSPIAVTGQQLDGWFTTYSNQFSVDRGMLWKIAVCESGLNTQARNGDYGGLYQFATRTWQTTRTTMNLDPNPDLRFNPEEAIKTAAFKIAAGGLSSWPNCGK